MDFRSSRRLENKVTIWDNKNANTGTRNLFIKYRQDEDRSNYGLWNMKMDVKYISDMGNKFRMDTRDAVTDNHNSHQS